jgi:hypothetical protein
MSPSPTLRWQGFTAVVRPRLAPGQHTHGPSATVVTGLVICAAAPPASEATGYLNVPAAFEVRARSVAYPPVC